MATTLTSCFERVRNLLNMRWRALSLDIDLPIRKNLRCAATQQGELTRGIKLRPEHIAAYFEGGVKAESLHCPEYKSPSANSDLLPNE